MRRAMLVLGAALVAALIWGPHQCRLLDTRGVGCGMCLVEFRGRLLDAAGAPLAQRGLCALSDRKALANPKVHTAFARLTAAARATRGGASADEVEAWESMYVSPEAHALTDAGGAFRVRLDRWTCTYVVGGEQVSRSEPAPRSVLHALLIEGAPGEPPFAVQDLPAGTSARWPRQDPASLTEFIVDLGDVRVPSRPPSPDGS